MEPKEEVPVIVYDEPAAAGPGNPLTQGSYETLNFPVNSVPDGTSFGVRVSGSSMYPRFVDKQIVFVEQSMELYNGEIGVFNYDGEAYIKKYIVEQPTADEVQNYISSDGRVMPKVTLYSLNCDCAHMDVHVMPGHSFQIVGRVLN